MIHAKIHQPLVPVGCLGRRLHDRLETTSSSSPQLLSIIQGQGALLTRASPPRVTKETNQSRLYARSAKEACFVRQSQLYRLLFASFAPAVECVRDVAGQTAISVVCGGGLFYNTHYCCMKVAVYGYFCRGNPSGLPTSQI